MIKIAALCAATTGVILMTSCAGSPHEATEKYVLVTANTKISYWQTAASGMNHAATEMKVKSEVVGPDTYDPKAEHDEFVRAIQQKPTGIMVAVTDEKLLAPDIETAIKQGIPVITVDSDAPTSKRLLFVGTDNYNAGRLGGQLLVKLLGGKGDVVVFTYPGQLNLNERLNGYKSAFEQTPGIKITQTVDIKGDPTVAFDTAKKLIDSKAKVDAFVCLEALACPEVGEVVNRANMAGKVKILAMDTDQRTLGWIQKDVISATIAQKPYTMTYFGAKMLDDLHHHPPTSLTADFADQTFSPLPTLVDTGTVIVNKDNVAGFIQQNQAHGMGQ